MLGICGVGVVSIRFYPLLPSRHIITENRRCPTFIKIPCRMIDICDIYTIYIILGIWGLGGLFTRFYSFYTNGHTLKEVQRQSMRQKETLYEFHRDNLHIDRYILCIAKQKFEDPFIKYMVARGIIYRILPILAILPIFDTRVRLYYKMILPELD